MGENSRKTAKVVGKPFKAGETGNPNGRPKGQRNYATIYREALEKIAASQNMTPEEIETIMEEAGIRKAIKGDFQFWKDIRDRLHGKALDRASVEITTPTPLLANVRDNNSIKEAPEAKEED